MTFAEFDNTTQEKIIDLLNNHIATTADILKKDRCLIPMLMIPDSNQLVSLHSRVRCGRYYPEHHRAEAHLPRQLRQ